MISIIEFIAIIDFYGITRLRQHILSNGSHMIQHFLNRVIYFLFRCIDNGRFISAFRNLVFIFLRRPHDHWIFRCNF